MLLEEVSIASSISEICSLTYGRAPAGWANEWGSAEHEIEVDEP
jgi:hypothetical protein